MDIYDCTHCQKPITDENAALVLTTAGIFPCHNGYLGCGLKYLDQQPGSGSVIEVATASIADRVSEIEKNRGKTFAEMLKQVRG